MKWQIRELYSCEKVVFGTWKAIYAVVPNRFATVSQNNIGKKMRTFFLMTWDLLTGYTLCCKNLIGTSEELLRKKFLGTLFLSSLIDYLKICKIKDFR